MSIRNLWTVAAAAVLVTSACGGLSPEDQPRLVNTDRVPEALVAPGPTPPGPDLSPSDGGVDADLFLFLGSGSDQLIVPCAVPTTAGGSVEARARAVTERLINLVPGIDNDCPDALVNAVPPDLIVLSVRVVFGPEGNVLDLNLNKDSLGAIEATEQRRAIAQLVFTTTSVPGVSAVRFFADGTESSVPVEDRTADPGEPVSPADFPTLNESLNLWNQLAESGSRPGPAEPGPAPVP